MSLPKKHHILFNGSFVNEPSLVERFGSFKFIWNPNKKQSNFQIAVIVGKKIDKRAVKRNWLKRRIHQVFLNILKEFSLKPIGLLVFPKKEVFNKSKEELKKEIIVFLTENDLILNA